MKISTIVIVSFAALLGARPLFAQNDVGVMLSGYEKDCEVIHLGKPYRCSDQRHLYIGDVITKKPSIKTLKIKWAPYVSGAIKDEISMEVVSQPERLKGKTGAASLKQNILDSVKPPEHVEIPTFTRTMK